MALTPVMALSQDFRTATLGFLLGVALTCAAQLGFRPVFLRLLVVNSFTLFLWLTLPLTYPGAELGSVGPLSVTREGLELAALITVKTNGIVLVCIALIATSPVSDIGHALDKMRFPTKICLILIFSYRYIFVIFQEFQRLVRAAKLRCFAAGTNLHTYRTYGYLFAMTLLKSWHRAERVSQAMMLRGFNGKFYSLNDTTLGMTDIVFAGTMCCTAVGLCSLELLLL